MQRFKLANIQTWSLSSGLSIYLPNPREHRRKHAWAHHCPQSCHLIPCEVLESGMTGSWGHQAHQADQQKMICPSWFTHSPGILSPYQVSCLISILILICRRNKRLLSWVRGWDKYANLSLLLCCHDLASRNKMPPCSPPSHLGMLLL